MAGRIAYLGNIATQGLVLNLDAAIKGSYPGTGTTWTDVSNNGNNSTLTNGPTFSSADYGSIVFDGVDDYVNCGSGITTTTTITVNAWVKLNVNNIYQHIVDSANNTWHLAMLPDGRIYFWDGNVYHTAGGILNINTWYMVTGVKTPTTNDVYINGILSNSLNSNISIPTNNVWIGLWQPPGTGRALNGSVASTQIYNRALSASEVLQNFNALRGRYGI
jgi:hypothetical protein